MRRFMVAFGMAIGITLIGAIVVLAVMYLPFAIAWLVNTIGATLTLLVFMFLLIFFVSLIVVYDVIED